MNRRAFLTGLLATAVLDPEKLLWVPGKKTISIPAAIVAPSDELFMNLDMINYYTKKYIVPHVVDNVFRAPPRLGR